MMCIISIRIVFNLILIMRLGDICDVIINSCVSITVDLYLR